MIVNNHMDIEVRRLQRITNCVIIQDRRVLLLQKPRRGWWVAPGGKMDLGESIREACIRECKEETDLQVKHPDLRGIFTFIIKDGEKVVSEWMMFTFCATVFTGKNMNETREGRLAWHDVDYVSHLPMAAGDYYILDHVINRKGLLYGTFEYTEDFTLLSYRLDNE